MLEIYTDGACSRNGCKNNQGGWGFVVIKDETKIYENSGASKNTSNQKMELEAAIQACLYVSASFGDIEFVIYSDSAYLINCFNEKWYRNWMLNNWLNSKKQPVANSEQWKILIPFFNNPKVSWKKVKGHSGVQDWNAYVDNLAVKARLE